MSDKKDEPVGCFFEFGLLLVLVTAAVILIGEKVKNLESRVDVIEKQLSAESKK